MLPHLGWLRSYWFLRHVFQNNVTQQRLSDGLSSTSALLRAQLNFLKYIFKHLRDLLSGVIVARLLIIILLIINCNQFNRFIVAALIGTVHNMSWWAGSVVDNHSILSAPWSPVNHQEFKNDIIQNIIMCWIRIIANGRLSGRGLHLCREPPKLS